jgi:hypothetical protein
MGFIVSRLNAFIINRSGGVVFLPTKAAMAFLPVLLTVQIYRLRALIYRLSFATTSAVSR